MTDGRCILVEGPADRLLISMMGFERPFRVPGGIGGVAKAMKNSYKNRKAIGVVDNDKAKHPKYFDDFKTEERIGNHFILKYLPNTKHYLILVNPVFEKCIFNIAEKLEVNPEMYGFKSLKQFKNATKDENVHKNQNVKQFLNTLIQKKDSPLKKVKTWIVEKLNE